MTPSNQLIISKILTKHFPDFSADLINDIALVAELRDIHQDTILMDVGNYIKSVPLMYEGMMKIFREDEDDNELFLYYMYPGQACAISFVCSEIERKSKVRALTIRPSKFVFFPIKYMDIWMLKHKTWYQFVLRSFNERFEDVLKTIDDVAFHNMDERLIRHLLKIKLAYGTDLLKVSHQDIANELNSSREVISRLLKKLEHNGKIKMGRGKIEIIALDGY